jgi:hypothetical protein
LRACKAEPLAPWNFFAFVQHQLVRKLSGNIFVRLVLCHENIPSKFWGLKMSFPQSALFKKLNGVITCY